VLTGCRRDDVHRGRMLGALLRRAFPVFQDSVAETRSVARALHPRLLTASPFVWLTLDSEYTVCCVGDDVSRLSAFIWLLSNRNLCWDEACAL
jgi:hypothetical protein